MVYETANSICSDTCVQQPSAHLNYEMCLFASVRRLCHRFNKTLLCIIIRGTRDIEGERAICVW